MENQSFNLDKMKTAELIKLYSAILSSLKKRGVIRSKNFVSWVNISLLNATTILLDF